MKNVSSKTWSEVSTGTSVVDFYSTSCGPCRVIAPTLEGLSIDYESENITFGKFNVSDDEDGLFQKFRVSAVPTIMILKDGVEVARVVGVQSESELKKWIDSKK